MFRTNKYKIEIKDFMEKGNTLYFNRAYIEYKHKPLLGLFDDTNYNLYLFERIKSIYYFIEIRYGLLHKFENKEIDKEYLFRNAKLVYILDKNNIIKVMNKGEQWNRYDVNTKTYIDYIIEKPDGVNGQRFTEIEYKEIYD